MREQTLIAVVVIALLVMGALTFCHFMFSSDFTFHSAELSFEGDKVREMLAFVPDKPYHTLYRNFVTRIGAPDVPGRSEHIQIDEVGCSAGIPYYRDFNGEFFSYSSTDSLSYTEPNEYGCGFGDVRGFEKGKEYLVSADYRLNPTTLFEIGGRSYIKFVAYEKLRHPLLVRGKNFIVGEGAITEQIILPRTDAVIYVPFEPSNKGDYAVKKEYRFEPLRTWGFLLLEFLICILPALICLLVWRSYGKEETEGDFPPELSQYPNERKAWEVSAYFSPPFWDLNRDFMPAVILEFYSRKIIDLRFSKGKGLSGGDMLIKLMPSKAKLDDVEEEILEFLRFVESKYKKVVKGPYDGFFSFKKTNSGVSGNQVWAEYEKLKSSVLKKRKEHLDYKGSTRVYLWLIFLGVFASFIYGLNLAFMLLSFILAVIVGNRTTLFVRFNKDYYPEFQKWRAFRRFLSNSDSLRRSPPRGVVMWEKYLVYATALGVGKTVLKQMKDLKVIGPAEYEKFSGAYMPTSFGTAPSSGGGSGGGGGGSFGGGGIGGGGGGGR